jgi:hypothetical protein
MHVYWQPLPAKMIVLNPAPVSRVFMPGLGRAFNSRHVLSSIRQSECSWPSTSWSFGGSASSVCSVTGNLSLAREVFFYVFQRSVCSGAYGLFGQPAEESDEISEELKGLHEKIQRRFKLAPPGPTYRYVTSSRLVLILRCRQCVTPAVRCRG